MKRKLETDDDEMHWTKVPLTEHRHSFNLTSVRKLHLSRAKLKASSRASALLSGFAMVAMIELTIEVDENNRVPEALLIAFTLCASLLIVVHISALLISTCVLPQLECYIGACEVDGSTDSPYERVRWYIEMAWIFSTALGMLLFLVVVVLACWVKFWNISKWSAGVCFLIVGPVVVVFMLFAVFFYRTLISFKYAHASRLVDSLDRWMLELERGSCTLPTAPNLSPLTLAATPPHASSLPASPAALRRPTIVTRARDFFDFVVVGGGIAGVVCAETLCELIAPPAFAAPERAGESADEQTSWRVCLISASHTLKTAVNVQRVTRLLESFDVAERASDDWSHAWAPYLTVIVDTITRVDCDNRLVHLAGHIDRPLMYGRICLATGGVPRQIAPQNPLVLTLRDTESVARFRSRLAGARRVILVGNGGIATEVAYEIEDCQVLWVVKHENISMPFLDPAASQFLLRSGLKRRRRVATNEGGEGPTEAGGESKAAPLIRTLRYTLAERSDAGADSQTVAAGMGSALGPDWAQGQNFTGLFQKGTLKRPIKVVYKCQVEQLLCPSEFAASGCTAVEADSEGPLLPASSSYDWPIYVRLTNGECYGADFVICATGVEANLSSEQGPTPSARCPVVLECPRSGAKVATAPAAAGGGLVVDELMQASVPRVYAAGDCAFAGWEPKAPHWFQMRLWSQARQSAFQAAKSMFYHTVGEEVPLDFSFELFTHVTHFFGFKVVFLGLFNGQGLDMTAPDVYVLLRITSEEEYVKCVMKNGRMQGALLIGETDLEETFENLILNQLDLSLIGENLLDPNIDISDYFD